MTNRRMIDTQAFIERHTALLPVAACPEISVHTAPSLDAIWEPVSAFPGAPATPAFWAVGWSGGQALARYLLDNPQTVAGKTVFDLGSGSGLCAIAAAMAGARRTVANDTDPLAGQAIAMNARANGVAVTVDPSDPFRRAPADADVVTAGDMWYERHTAERANAWLSRCAEAGRAVYLGDKRRAFFPRSGTRMLAAYEIDTGTDHEAKARTAAFVWEFTGLK